MSDEEPPAPLSGPVVIDASSVVEYLVVLTLTDAATRLFHMAGRGDVDLWAPDLVYAESASALRKLVQRNALAAGAAERAVEHLLQLPIAVTGSRPLIPVVWSMRDFLTPYDACYVALAGELGADFVSAERELTGELRRRGRRARYLGDL